MATAAEYPHLMVAADGSVRIGDSRYKVLHLAAEHYHHGWSAEELLRQHPDLRPEEVYAALAYFYDHFQPMLAQMNARDERGEAHLQKQTLTRDQLLQRRTATKE